MTKPGRTCLPPRCLASGGVTIERGDIEPVYRQLAAILRARIDSGEIPPRRAIPSKRTLMQEYGVALGTVNKALALLREDGYLVSVQGLGTFVTPPEDRAPGQP
jgi:GntR family transcriptional regulator